MVQILNLNGANSKSKWSQILNGAFEKYCVKDN